MNPADRIRAALRNLKEDLLGALDDGIAAADEQQQAVRRDVEQAMGAEKPRQE